MQNTPFYALFCFKSLQIRGVKPGFEYCFIVMMQVGRITKVLTGWLLSKANPSVRPYIGSRAWGSPKMNLLELVQRKEEGDVNSAERLIYSSSSLRKKLHGCKTFWLLHTTEVTEEDKDKESVSKE